MAYPGCPSPLAARHLLALVLGVALAGVASGADLVEVYELARVNDPDFRAAEANLRARLEERPQARAALRPQVALDANATYIDADTPQADDSYVDSGVGVSLSQTLYRRDQLVQRGLAEASVAQAEAEFAAAAQTLILNVAERYFDVLAARDNLEFARAEKEAIAQQLEQAQRRFEVGLIAITDVKEAQARFDLAVAQEIEADNLLAISREALVVVVGTKIDRLRPLAEDAPLTRPQPDIMDEWVVIAEVSNPQLRATRQATEVARQSIEINRSGKFPTVDLVARHAYQDSGGGFIEGDSTSTSVGVELVYPLYTGGATTSRVQQARAEFDAARERLEKQRRTTVQQARDAFLGVSAAISRVQALKQALVSTQAGAEATQAGFEVGTRTAVEVLIALQETYRAERDYARARYDHQLNLLRLKQAAGTLDGSDVQAVNRWLR